MIDSLVARFGLAGLLLSYLWGRRLWWLIPMVVVLLVLGLLVILAEASVVGPFIYTLF
jgi:hypothetical protein